MCTLGFAGGLFTWIYAGLYGLAEGMGVEPTQERWRPQQDLKSCHLTGDDAPPWLKLQLL